MLCLNLKSTDPCFNLAVDEYLLRNSTGDFFILSVNSPSVIIGKHQVAHREADTEYVTKYRIPVIRRISGGGTVFHDKGNLNFSFILRSTQGKQVDFRKYTLPVISFLESMGVNAKFEGKNDLKVKGLKISGNAEHIYREKVLHHGTLLFDADLGKLKRSIRKDTSGYSTRAVESNPSSVMNIKDIISPAKDIEEFRTDMFSFFVEQKGNKITELTQTEISAIESLADTRYRTWEWNYAYGPEYQFKSIVEMSGTQFEWWFLVRGGIIMDCRTDGPDEVQAVGKRLIGSRHMPDDLLSIFEESEINILAKSIFSFF